MKNCVYSFWTKPSIGGVKKMAKNWLKPEFLGYSTVISVMHSRNQFDKLTLITDNDGFDFIVKIGLEQYFDEILLDLENIDVPHDFWAYGKIVAYEIMAKKGEPFVHIDFDSFFAQKPSFEDAQLIVSNIEDGTHFESVYRYLVNYCTAKNYVLPELFGKVNFAYCTAILGGLDTDTILDYCKAVKSFVSDNEDRIKNYDGSEHKEWFNVIFEQYILACVLEAKGIKPRLQGDLNNKMTFFPFVHIWGAKNSLLTYNSTRLTCERLYKQNFDLIKNYFN